MTRTKTVTDFTLFRIICDTRKKKPSDIRYIYYTSIINNIHDRVVFKECLRK